MTRKAPRRHIKPVPHYQQLVEFLETVVFEETISSPRQLQGIALLAAVEGMTPAQYLALRAQNAQEGIGTDR